MRCIGAGQAATGLFSLLTASFLWVRGKCDRVSEVPGFLSLQRQHRTHEERLDVCFKTFASRRLPLSVGRTQEYRP